MAKRDLTNHEWKFYWERISNTPEQALELIRLANLFCERAGATRREFIKARESGELLFPENPTAEDLEANYLAAVEAGFIDPEDKK